VGAPAGAAFPGPAPEDAPGRPGLPERGTGDASNDAYDSAYLASSWPDPDEDRAKSTYDADMDAVMQAQDEEHRQEWREGKSEESTLSADMAALLEEEDRPRPPSGPSYGGPPPDEDRPDSEYRL
jgi:hippurate hydrolase